MIRATGRRRNEASPSRIAGHRQAGEDRRRTAAGSSRSCRSRGSPSGSREAVGARARRPGSRPFRPSSREPLARVAPEGGHDPGRRADVGAVAGARDPALALGQGGQHQRPVADRLVAGQAQLARAGARLRRTRAASGRAAVPRPVLRQPAADRRARPPATSGSPCSGADVLVDGTRRGHQVARTGRGRAAARRRTGPRPGRGWTSTMTPSAPDRDAADRQRLDEPALAGGVRRVDDDRQVGQVVEQRHGGEVHRVARVRLERPDAALAEDHVGVAGADDVLGGHQPLLDRWRRSRA